MESLEEVYVPHLHKTIRLGKAVTLVYNPKHIQHGPVKVWPVAGIFKCDRGCDNCETRVYINDNRNRSGGRCLFTHLLRIEILGEPKPAIINKVMLL